MIGAHVIFPAYGMWLSNDPRGSWSDFVGSWELFVAGGRATKTTKTHSLAHRPHDRDTRLATKQALQRPTVQFDGVQAKAVGDGFADYVQRSGLVVWACAIMPDHVLLVVKPCRARIPDIVIQLKGAATRQLIAAGVHPFAERAGPDGRMPKCWARGQWKVFLDREADVRRAIQYVEDNPVKDHKPRQRWSFVTPLAVSRDAPAERGPSAPEAT